MRSKTSMSPPNAWILLEYGIGRCRRTGICTGVCTLYLLQNQPHRTLDRDKKTYSPIESLQEHQVVFKHPQSLNKDDFND